MTKERKKKKKKGKNPHNFPDHILHDLPNNTLDYWDHHCLKLQFQPESTEMGGKKEKKKQKTKKDQIFSKTFDQERKPISIITQTCI